MNLISVNLGQEKSVQRKGSTERTGIFKFPVEGPVRIRKPGLEDNVMAGQISRFASMIYGTGNIMLKINFGLAATKD